MRSDGPALLPVFRSQHQAELLMWLYLHPDAEYGVSELAERRDIDGALHPAEPTGG